MRNLYLKGIVKFTTSPVSTNRITIVKSLDIYVFLSLANMKCGGSQYVRITFYEVPSPSPNYFFYFLVTFEGRSI